jgi:hypothetical protein
MHLRHRHGELFGPARRLVRAIEEGDETAISEAVVRVSRSRRVLAPLAWTVGAVGMLLVGVKTLLANWRLTLVQIVPAVWIWLAMYDLKAHVLHGKSFHALRGPVLIPINLAIVAITAASFFLTAIFAFAISGPPPPAIGPAHDQARSNARTILLWGGAVGALLGVSTTVLTRSGKPWFALSLGIVVGIMAICYVAVPARIVGVKPAQSPREKLTATATGAALSTMVCTPPYLLGRLGILMLGSSALLVPGIIVMTLGFTLQAGATGAVRAIKMSMKLVGAHNAPGPGAPDRGAPSGVTLER